MTAEHSTFVTHLECAMTGERSEPDRVHGLSAADTPLLVRYDLEVWARAVDKELLARRVGGFWRYREFWRVRWPAPTDGATSYFRLLATLR